MTAVTLERQLSTGGGKPCGLKNTRFALAVLFGINCKRSALRTDYIDLYLHVWEGTTPVEEISRSMDDLVRQGKVLYLGLSDIPAWQVSRMQAVRGVASVTLR